MSTPWEAEDSAVEESERIAADLTFITFTTAADECWAQPGHHSLRGIPFWSRCCKMAGLTAALAAHTEPRTVEDLPLHLQANWDQLATEYAVALNEIRQLRDDLKTAQANLAFERDRADEAQNVRWDDSCAPGGYVCRTCGVPVESEPCAEHAPQLREETETLLGLAIDRYEEITTVINHQILNGYDHDDAKTAAILDAKKQLQEIMAAKS